MANQVKLPYDIWLYISSFLPSNTLWQLRGLNQALYDIAMDNRYKRVEIPMRYSKIKHYSRNFLRFRVDIAKRVQEIAYYPDAKTVFPPTKGSKLAKTFSAVKKRLDNFGVGDQRLVNDTIAAFTNIKSLSIQFSRIAEGTLQECIPLFYTNFRVSSDSLRKITLSLPQNKISTVLPLDLYLPRLDALSLIFSPSTNDAEPVDRPSFKDTASTVLAPFVNRHRNTLVHVDFRIYGLMESWPPLIIVFPISPLFQAVGRINHLRYISIGISQLDNLESVASFIRTHSETVDTLIIYLIDVHLSPDKLFAYIGERPFPNIKVLSIREREHEHMQNFSLEDHGSRSSITTFIHRCTPSLTSLSLTHSKYSRESISHLLNPSQNTPISFSALSFLHVTLGFFTAEVMNLFVDCLPNLYELDLVVYMLLDEDTGLLKDQQDDEFCLQITRYDHGNWGLKHFDIVVMEGRRKNRRPSDRAGALLVWALPSLITFCGTDRATYLVRAPMRGDRRCVVFI